MNTTNCDHGVHKMSFDRSQRSPTVNKTLLLSGQTLRSQSSKLRVPEGKPNMTGELAQGNLHVFEGRCQIRKQLVSEGERSEKCGSVSKRNTGWECYHPYLWKAVTDYGVQCRPIPRKNLYLL